MQYFADIFEHVQMFRLELQSMGMGNVFGAFWKDQNFKSGRKQN